MGNVGCESRAIRRKHKQISLFSGRRGRRPLQGLRVVLLLVADRGRFVNRPYGVAGRGNVGRGSRDVEGAVPYNTDGTLVADSAVASPQAPTLRVEANNLPDKSKFEDHPGYVITFLW